VSSGCDVFEVRVPDGSPFAKAPSWRRCYALGADGTVFVPSSITDRSEAALYWAAGWDGTEVVRHGDHLYFPSGWIIAECPEAAEAARVIERIAHKHQGRAA
jgi:hypothetical protein